MSTSAIVLELGTIVNFGPIAEGFGAVTEIARSSTNAMASGFTELAAATTTADDQMASSMAALGVAVESLTTAITAMPARVVPAVEETSGAFAFLEKRMLETAAVAKASAGGIGAAFGTLGALLGAGALVEAMAHFADETSKEVLALGNLEEKTGISISALAGLQLIAKELAVSFGSIEQGLVRLDRAQSLAVKGYKAQEQGFRLIGISVNELRGLTPEELLNRVSEGFQQTGSSADRANAAVALLGRGGKELIPIFEKYGATLGEVIDKTGEETGVTERARVEFLKWQKITADMGDEIRKIAIEIIPLITSGFINFNALLEDIFLNAIIGFEDVETYAVGMYKAVADSVKGNFTQATKEMDEATAEVGLRNTVTAMQIAKIWEDAAARIKGVDITPPKPHKDVPDPGSKTDNKEYEQQIAALNAQMAAVQEYSKAYFDLAQQRYEVAVKFYGEESKQASEEMTKILDARRRVNNEVTAENERAGVESSALQLKLAQDVDTERLKTGQETVLQWKANEFTAIEGWYTDRKAVLEKALDDARNIYGEDSRAYQAAADEMKKVDEERLLAIQKVIDKAATEDTQLEAAAARTAEAGMRQADQQVQAAEKSQNIILKIQEDSDNKRLKMGAETIGQWQSNEMNAITAWYDADKAALDKALEYARITYGEESSEYQKLKDKEMDLDQKYVLAAQKIGEKVEETYKQSYDKITNTLNASIVGMITSHETLGQAVQKVFQSIVTMAIDAILKIAEQWVFQHIVMAAASSLFHTKESAEEIAAAAAHDATIATNNAGNVAMATSDAFLAAAAALAWWSAVDPPIAPAMAAATLSEGLAFAGGAGFEKGGLVPETGMAMLHGGEMVLPAELSKGVQGMVAQGGPGARGSDGESGSDGASSSSTTNNFHYHGGSIQAIDGHSAAAVLKTQNRTIEQIVRKSFQTGHLSLKR